MLWVIHFITRQLYESCTSRWYCHTDTLYSMPMAFIYATHISQLSFPNERSNVDSLISRLSCSLSRLDNRTVFYQYSLGSSYFIWLPHKLNWFRLCVHSHCLLLIQMRTEKFWKFRCLQWKINPIYCQNLCRRLEFWYIEKETHTAEYELKYTNCRKFWLIICLQMHPFGVKVCQNFVCQANLHSCASATSIMISDQHFVSYSSID